MSFTSALPLSIALATIATSATATVPWSSTSLRAFSQSNHGVCDPAVSLLPCFASLDTGRDQEIDEGPTPPRPGPTESDEIATSIEAMVDANRRGASSSLRFVGDLAGTISAHGSTTGSAENASAEGETWVGEGIADWRFEGELPSADDDLFVSFDIGYDLATTNGGAQGAKQRSYARITVDLSVVNLATNEVIAQPMVLEDTLRNVNAGEDRRLDVRVSEVVDVPVPPATPLGVTVRVVARSDVYAGNTGTSTAATGMVNVDFVDVRFAIGAPPTTSTTTTSTTSTTTLAGTVTTTTAPSSTTTTTLPELLAGRKLVLRPQALVTVVRDSGLTLGRGNGSADDPTLVGGAFRLTSSPGGALLFDTTIALPPAAWRRIGREGAGKGYKARGVRPIKKIVVKPGRLTLVARGDLGVSLASNPDPVQIELALGEHVACTWFPDGRHKAGKKYTGRRSGRPAGCAGGS